VRGVKWYEVQQVGGVTKIQYVPVAMFSGLARRTTYTFTIRPVDFAGNIGPPVAIVATTK